MEFKKMLVVIPHSGITIPFEIPVQSLSDKFPDLTRNIDWYTNWLYDFHDILGNSSVIFGYCSLVLEANRDPEDLESSVPLKDIAGDPVFRPDHEPDRTLRRYLARKYLDEYHRRIENEISLGKTFMLDAHSTVTARGVEDNQIELMNYQLSPQTGQKVRFCPDIFVETYAEALAKRLPGIRVTVNESGYHSVYGHICGKHSVDAMTRVGNRVPAILQETNQNLYMKLNGTPDIEAIEMLRRSFAGALYDMGTAVHAN
ncbi:MAG: N-formylglutamate amidohydrolase [Dehalococcoidales bacterium]|nr:N-formylglutamate amidohydrolase [Dehalococcoidales bacterium]